MYVCMYVSMYLSMYVCIHVCTLMYVCICLHCHGNEIQNKLLTDSFLSHWMQQQQQHYSKTCLSLFLRLLYITAEDLRHLFPSREIPAKSAIAFHSCTTEPWRETSRLVACRGFIHYASGTRAPLNGTRGLA